MLEGGKILQANNDVKKHDDDCTRPNEQAKNKNEYTAKHQLIQRKIDEAKKN